MDFRLGTHSWPQRSQRYPITVMMAIGVSPTALRCHAAAGRRAVGRTGWSRAGWRRAVRLGLGPGAVLVVLVVPGRGFGEGDAGLFSGLPAGEPVAGGLVGLGLADDFSLGLTAGFEAGFDFGSEEYHGVVDLHEDGEGECGSGGYGEAVGQQGKDVWEAGKQVFLVYGQQQDFGDDESAGIVEPMLLRRFHKILPLFRMAASRGAGVTGRVGISVAWDSLYGGGAVKPAFGAPVRRRVRRSRLRRMDPGGSAAASVACRVSAGTIPGRVFSPARGLAAWRLLLGSLYRPLCVRQSGAPSSKSRKSHSFFCSRPQTVQVIL